MRKRATFDHLHGAHLMYIIRGSRRLRTGVAVVTVGGSLALVAPTGVASAAAQPVDSIRNGRIAYQAYPNGFPQLYTIGPAGDRKRLTHNKTFNSDPAWSPSGRRIAFMYYDGNDVEIFIMRSDGTHVRAVTDDATNEFHPTWSPSGRRLAFTYDDGNDLEIFTSRLDATGLRRLTDNDRNDLHPDWSPSGRWIAYDSVGSKDPEIRAMRPDGSAVRRVTRNRTWDSDPSFAPSGGRIAYTGCNKLDHCQIFIRSLFGGPRRKLTDNARNHSEPTWSPNGRRIAFIVARRDNRRADVFSKGLARNDRRRITFSPRLIEENPDWAVHPRA
jgi:TolB protein